MSAVLAFPSMMSANVLIALLSGLIAIVLILQIGIVQRLVLGFLALFPAAILMLLSLLAVPLWRPLLWVVSRVSLLDAVPARVEGSVNWLARRKKDKLVQGEREAFAKSIWATDDYPWLYEEVPEDIRRPLWEDGRLPGGFDLTWLADRHISTDLVKEAARAGLVAAILLVLVPVTLFLVISMGAVFAPLSEAMNAELAILERWPDGSVVRESRWTLFGQGAGLAVLTFLDFLWKGALYLLLWVIFGAGAGILTMLVVIERWRRQKAEPYEIVSKDADVRWPYRAEARKIANNTYARQVELSLDYLEDSPLFEVGKSTGTLRLRGDLNAPLDDVSMNLDGDSLFQHLMVLGGTGEGKTTAILKPLLKQFLGVEFMGLYVCDAKGVLWKDAKTIAEAAGRKADIRVIGTAKGQHGVDALSSLTPSQIAGVLRSVLTQLGGGNNSDSFWPDMAATAMRHALTIGHGFAQTEEGKRYKAESSENAAPYSLWWAYQALIDEAVLKTALDAINASLEGFVDQKSPDKPAYTILTASALSASRSYMAGQWEELAGKTRTGIIASVSQLMDGFSGAPELRKRFISGPSKNTISISDALNGKIVLSALSNVEDGLPATLVNILLKTCLYREARLREARLKAKGENPQSSPCVVMMDEVQEIVTVDATSGLSDASFWNVARSTGLVGVFATQTIAALEQSMGEAAAKNFLQQARSKIFLRSEDRATVDYACWCAGEFERNRVFDNNQKESIDHRYLIDGWNPYDPIDTEDAIPMTSGWRLLLGAARMLISINRQQIGTAQSKQTYSPDLRFVPITSWFKLGYDKDATNTARLQALQAAHWRSEDLEHKYRTEGNQMTAALTPADVIGMGRWHAYALIQRAGAMRQDIITLKHDFD